MASLDWSQCPAVESIPGKVNGAWVFRNTRLPVATVIENLEDLGIEEVMEQFDVTREQITAALDFMAQSLRPSAPAQGAKPAMLILFDHGTPRGLARALSGPTVITAKARGWDRLSNGALLKAAEEAAFDILLTTDQGIRYQQNLTGRKIAIVVLSGTTKWSRVQMHLDRIAATVNTSTPGSYTEVDVPFDERAPA